MLSRSAETPTFLAWPAVEGGTGGIAATLLDPTFAEVPGRRIFIPLPTHPACPSAATSGDDIVLVWSRSINGISGEADTIEAARFGKDLTLLERATRLTSSSPVGTRPSVAWKDTAGGTYLIAAGTQWLELRSSRLADARAFPLEPWNAGSTGPVVWTLMYDAVASAGTSFALTARGRSTSWSGCNFARPGCGSDGPFTSIAIASPHWLWPDSIASQRSANMSPTTITCVGDDCLTVWFRYLSVDAAPATAVFEVYGKWSSQTRWVFLGMSAGASGLTSASDGERVLVVWESPANALQAAILTPGGIQESFLLATGSEPRAKPSAGALGSGRFLVGYAIEDSAVSHRLGGRIVNLNVPARRRIAR
ncbi:MAG: hypothetical protein ABIO78_07615 [Thermoanaerobaculia bacterium]